MGKTVTITLDDHIKASSSNDPVPNGVNQIDSSSGLKTVEMFDTIKSLICANMDNTMVSVNNNDNGGVGCDILPCKVKRTAYQQIYNEVIAIEQRYAKSLEEIYTNLCTENMYVFVG